MSKTRINATIIDDPFTDGLLILGESIPFRILQRMFHDYRLILYAPDSDIVKDVYHIKKEMTKIGTVTVVIEKEFPVGLFTKYITRPSVSIMVDRKYKDKVLESIQQNFDLAKQIFKCPRCQTEDEPVAKRQSASYGKAPYSVELSYNCPECGHQYWPRSQEDLHMNK